MSASRTPCWRYSPPTDAKVPRPEGEAFSNAMPFPPLEPAVIVDSLGPCLRCGLLPSEHPDTKDAIDKFFKATEDIDKFTPEAIDAAYRWSREQVPEIAGHRPLLLNYHGRVCCVCHGHAPNGVFLQFPQGRAPIAFDGTINQCICDPCANRIVEIRRVKDVS